MEKISKKELMKKLNLTEEELEKVAGGSAVNDCYKNAIKDHMVCSSICMERFEETNVSRYDCIHDCDKDQDELMNYCNTL